MLLMKPSGVCPLVTAQRRPVSTIVRSLSFLHGMALKLK